MTITDEEFIRKQLTKLTRLETRAIIIWIDGVETLHEILHVHMSTFISPLEALCSSRVSRVLDCVDNLLCEEEYLEFSDLMRMT